MRSLPISYPASVQDVTYRPIGSGLARCTGFSRLIVGPLVFDSLDQLNKLPRRIILPLLIQLDEVAGDEMRRDILENSY